MYLILPCTYAFVFWHDKCSLHYKDFLQELRIKTQKGFSVIELLIVVAIILIIAAIAIPHLLRSRMASNEASAVGSMRTIITAEITYSSTYATSLQECSRRR